MFNLQGTNCTIWSALGRQLLALQTFFSNTSCIFSTILLCDTCTSFFWQHSSHARLAIYLLLCIFFSKHELHYHPLIQALHLAKAWQVKHFSVAQTNLSLFVGHNPCFCKISCTSFCTKTGVFDETKFEWRKVIDCTCC